MNKHQMFWKGFWSVFEIRPFSEKAGIRTREEMDTEYAQLREKLGLNESVWDSVGGYIRKAMLEDIENYERKQ
jgi:hypothetical protein